MIIIPALMGFLRQVKNFPLFRLFNASLNCCQVISWNHVWLEKIKLHKCFHGISREVISFQSVIVRFGKVSIRNVIWNIYEFFLRVDVSSLTGRKTTLTVNCTSGIRMEQQLKRNRDWAIYLKLLSRCYLNT